jgi:hypothetical protein
MVTTGSFNAGTGVNSIHPIDSTLPADPSDLFGQVFFSSKHLLWFEAS